MIAGFGANIYDLTFDSGRPLLTFESHRCWQHYYNKIVHVSAQSDLREFECLFSPNVFLTRTPDKKQKKYVLNKQEETMAKGIEAVKEFLHANLPVRVCYSEFKSSGIYVKTLLAGSKEITISVDTSNLIAKVHYEDANYDSLLECKTSVLSAVS